MWVPLASVLWLIAASGDIEGQVLLPEKPPQKGPKRYPGNRDAEWKRGPAIVFLDGVPGEFAPPKAPVPLEQKNRQFSPLALAILQGTTVEFPNRDDEHHNVFSRSRAKELDLGRYGKNESRSVTFENPGVVRLRCEVHTNMHAVIVVLENPHFAVTDAEGRFVLRNVPAGKYKIYASEWEVPNVQDDVRALAYTLEAKYTFLPGFYGAVRWGQILFNEIPDGAGEETAWDRNAWRAEVGVGYLLYVNLLAKVQYEVNRTAGPNDPDDNVASFSLSLSW